MKPSPAASTLKKKKPAAQRDGQRQRLEETTLGISRTRDEVDLWWSAEQQQLDPDRASAFPFHFGVDNNVALATPPTRDIDTPNETTRPKGAPVQMYDSTPPTVSTLPPSTATAWPESGDNNNIVCLPFTASSNLPTPSTPTPKPPASPLIAVKSGRYYYQKSIKKVLEWNCEPELAMRGLTYRPESGGAGDHLVSPVHQGGETDLKFRPENSTSGDNLEQRRASPLQGRFKTKLQQFEFSKNKLLETAKSHVCVGAPAIPDNDKPPYQNTNNVRPQTAGASAFHYSPRPIRARRQSSQVQVNHDGSTEIQSDISNAISEVEQSISDNNTVLYCPADGDDVSRTSGGDLHVLDKGFGEVTSLSDLIRRKLWEVGNPCKPAVKTREQRVLEREMQKRRQYEERLMDIELQRIRIRMAKLDAEDAKTAFEAKKMRDNISRTNSVLKPPSNIRKLSTGTGRTDKGRRRFDREKTERAELSRLTKAKEEAIKEKIIEEYYERIHELKDSSSIINVLNHNRSNTSVSIGEGNAKTRRPLTPLLKPTTLLPSDLDGRPPTPLGTIYSSPKKLVPTRNYRERQKWMSQELHNNRLYNNIKNAKSSYSRELLLNSYKKQQTYAAFRQRPGVSTRSAAVLSKKMS